MTCPRCHGPTTVLKTEPTSTGGKLRLRRCDRHGRFWTTSTEKLHHWLLATAIESAGNGSATAIADNSPLGGKGVPPSGISSLPSLQSGAPARVEPSRFEEFWVFYPRRVAKAAAAKTWSRMKLDQHADVIIAAIKLQRPEFLGREPDKVPHAATWLNGERWKDEADRHPRPVGRPAKSDGNIAELTEFLARGNG